MPRQCAVCAAGVGKALERMVSKGMSKREASEKVGISYDSVKRHFREATPRGGKPAAAAAPPRRKAAGALGAADTFREAFEMEPQPHQVEYMEADGPTLVLKGRQIGMSTAGAALAISVARAKPAQDVVIVSPSMRQSSEVAMKARLGLWNLGERMPQDSSVVMRLDNGSRIMSLAGTARAVRGYSAALLIMDEAAFVLDETWAAARPMVSATKGRVIVQSTPGLPVGWFWDLWNREPPGWKRMRVRSDEVSSVSREFLDAEQASMSPELFAQEYLAEFASTAAADLWTEEEWRRLVRRVEDE